MLPTNSFFLIFIWYFTWTAGAVNWGLLDQVALCVLWLKQAAVLHIGILQFAISSKLLVFNYKTLQAFLQLQSLVE